MSLGLSPRTWRVTPVVACLLGALPFIRGGHGGGMGGAIPFVLEGSRIDPKDILSGGPGKDGIPALVRPRVVSASAATYLRDTDRVLGITIGDEARAYPIRILNWHELVNDQLGDVPVLVSYCPLCGSGVAFDRRVAGATLEFGVSGLLYQSNVLMYDRTDEGLWSQLRMEAVSGPRAGSRLRALPITLASWGVWRALHPNGTVLAVTTGYARDYARDPYLGYGDHPGLMFPVLHDDPRRQAKEWIVGVAYGTTARAYPFEELARAPRPVEEDVAGLRVRVHFDPTTQTAHVTDAGGAPVPATYAFWFAWAAFHPETTIFEAAEGKAQQSTASLGDLLPLAEGNWWAYEERSRDGSVAAVERRQVRSRDAAGWLVRTRQQRHDRSPDDAALVVDERIVRRPDGLARRIVDSTREPAYLVKAPLESGRAWSGSDGTCRISGVDRAVHAAERWFQGCVEVTCDQGGLLRIVSSYAPGVGLVREDVWFGGFAIPVTGAPGGVASVSGGGSSPSASLVLTAWGRRRG